MFLDPRQFIVSKKLSFFRHIIGIISPKGGVGKTTIAVALSLVLSNKYGGIALLDLDISNPTTHIILGVDIKSIRIIEDKGILPIKLLDGDIEFMSIAFFTKDRLLPLRGSEASNAIIELFSITRWGKPILVVDMPPGFLDQILEFFRLSPNLKLLIISTTDVMSILSAKRAIDILVEEGLNILGVIGNMCRDNEDKELLGKKLGIEILSCIPWIADIQKLYGYPNNIKNLFERFLQPVLSRLSQG